MRDELKMRLFMAMSLSRMKNDVFKEEKTAASAITVLQKTNLLSPERVLLFWKSFCFSYF